jgi:hypothetical protein
VFLWGYKCALYPYRRQRAAVTGWSRCG